MRPRAPRAAGRAGRGRRRRLPCRPCSARLDRGPARRRAQPAAHLAGRPLRCRRGRRGLLRSGRRRHRQRRPARARGVPAAQLAAAARCAGGCPDQRSPRARAAVMATARSHLAARDSARGSACDVGSGSRGVAAAADPVTPSRPGAQPASGVDHLPALRDGPRRRPERIAGRGGRNCAAPADRRDAGDGAAESGRCQRGCTSVAARAGVVAAQAAAGLEPRACTVTQAGSSPADRCACHNAADSGDRRDADCNDVAQALDVDKADDIIVADSEIIDDKARRDIVAVALVIVIIERRTGSFTVHRRLTARFRATFFSRVIDTIDDVSCTSPCMSDV